MLMSNNDDADSNHDNNSNGNNNDNNNNNNKKKSNNNNCHSITRVLDTIIFQSVCYHHRTTNLFKCSYSSYLVYTSLSSNALTWLK